MPQMWRINLAFVLLLAGVILVPLIVGRVSMPFFQSDRAIGAPLDGDWYSGKEDGCFYDGEVYHFEEGRLYFRRYNNEIEFAAGVDSEPLKDVLKLQPDLRVPNFQEGMTGLMVLLERHQSPQSLSDERTYLFYRDDGRALWPLAAIFGDLSTNFEDEGAFLKPTWEMRRCTNPTIWGFIQSFWRPEYRADQTFRSIEVKDKSP